MSCLGLATLPDRLEESSCIWIARSLSERGLTMAAISGTFNLCDPHPTRLEHNLRNLEVLASACRWLDTRIITLCTGTRDPKDMWRWHSDNVRRSTWESLIENMKEACKIADRHEVTLAFEPEINNVVNSISKARRLLDEVGSPWLKVVLDPTNLIRPGKGVSILEILDEAFDWLGSEIVLAHAKDPALFQTEATSVTQAQIEALLSFRSGLYYVPYFMRLKRIGFTGAIVIHGLEENQVEARISLLRQTLEPLLDEV
jgi:sugar phosphate isomerase/epimerase